MKKQSPLWEIHIEKDENRYHYVIDNPRAGTISFRGTLDIPPASRNRVLNTFGDCLSVLGLTRGESAKTKSADFEEEAVPPEELGRMIFKYMFPPNCSEKLKNIESEFVRISTDDVEIPWELLHDGEEFFSLKNAVGRTVEAKTTIPDRERPDLSRTRILLVGNPTCDLEGAEEEVDILADMFESMNGVEFDMLKREEATSENLIFDHLKKKFYDIIHYAGHTKFKEAKPEESMIRLKDGVVTAQYMLNVLDPPPRLVLMNSCTSSASSEIEYWEREGKMTGLASSFLSSGVDHYIGTLWSVLDKISHDLSRNFYRELFNGNPIGVSLKKAKERTVEKHEDYFSPSSFILYGDPRTVYLGKEEEAEGREFPTSVCLDEETVSMINILNEDGDSEIEYHTKFRNISSESVENRVFDFHLLNPTSIEEFDLLAKSEEKRLKTHFIENMPTFKKFSVDFDSPLQPGEEKELLVAFKPKRLYDTEKEVEYWSFTIERPTKEKTIKVLLPPSKGLSSIKLVDASQNKCEEANIHSVEKDGRIQIICKIEEPVLEKNYKLMWEWD